MYPIPWNDIISWEDYQNFGDGGYKKFIYMCRNGSAWYDGSILKADGLVIDRYCTATNYLEMGNVTAAAASLLITAPPSDISSWAVGDEIEVQVDTIVRQTMSVPGDDVAKMGVFVIDSITVRDGNYTIECLDRMVYLDKPMNWGGLGTQTDFSSVLSKIEVDFGITVATDITTLPNYQETWYSFPEITARQAISAMAEVMGCCAYMDWNGQLRLQWYEPVVDENDIIINIADNIAVSRHTEDATWMIDAYLIGGPSDPSIDVPADGTAEYYLVGNPFIEGARTFTDVDALADEITQVRYMDVVNDNPEKLFFNGGEYTVLPLPYIWPLDVFECDGKYIPINHVTYRLNSNMNISASVNPVSTRSATFTSQQQTVINSMQSETEAINKHFFYNDATGAHITMEEGQPNLGKNILVDSNGLYVREDTDVLASFRDTGATIGKEDEGHVDITDDGLTVYTDSLVEAMDIKASQYTQLASWSSASYRGTMSPGSMDMFTVPVETDEIIVHISRGSGYQNLTELNAENSWTSTVDGVTYSYANGKVTVNNTTSSGIAFNGLWLTAYYTEYTPSIAIGLRAEAEASNAIAIGEGALADADNLIAFGPYNLGDTDVGGNARLIVGNGFNDVGGTGEMRNNALVLFRDGKVECGDVTVSNENSANAYEQILFKNAGAPYTGSYIRSYDVNATGSDIIVRPGGRLILGGGEYASNRYAAGSFEGTESAWLGADGAVFIESNGDTIANRKKWTFDTSGNITTPSGGLINGVDLAAIGTRQTYTSGTISLASGTTWTSLMSMTFDPGVWIFNGIVSFPSNATGRRAFCISNTATGSQNALLNLDVQNAVNGAQTVCHINSQFVLTAQTTYYFNAYQNSGSSLSVSPRMYAVRIK